MSPWILDHLIVDIDFVLGDLDLFSLGRNDPLDEILGPIFGIDENNDVAPLGFLPFEEFSYSERDPYAIDELADQDVIPHL